MEAKNLEKGHEERVLQGDRTCLKADGILGIFLKKG